MSVKRPVVEWYSLPQLIKTTSGDLCGFNVTKMSVKRPVVVWYLLPQLIKTTSGELCHFNVIWCIECSR